VYKQVFAGISNDDFKEISTILEKVRLKTLDFLKYDYTKEQLQILKDQSSQVSRALSLGEEGDDEKRIITSSLVAVGVHSHPERSRSRTDGGIIKTYIIWC
jgi:hypothetical protein